MVSLTLIICSETMHHLEDHYNDALQDHDVFYLGGIPQGEIILHFAADETFVNAYCTDRSINEDTEDLLSYFPCTTTNVYVK